MNDSIPITREGFEKIREELKRLKTMDHPRILQEVADARALGDSPENSEYQSAREKQEMIESRIADLELKFARLAVINPPPNGTSDSVILGAYVCIVDVDDEREHRYRIVGEIEGDVKNNAIPVSNPIGRALIRKQVGDVVSIALPTGEKEYEIVSISF